MNLVLVINGLDSGGAERSTIKLCESFIADGHEVTLITISSKSDFYHLKTSIRRINLSDEERSEWKFPSRLGVNRLAHWVATIRNGSSLRKILKSIDPDCVISMSAKIAVFTFLSTRFLRLAQIGSERIHPNPEVFSHGFVTDSLRPLIYRKGMLLSVQTAGVVNWCRDNWRVSGFLTPNHLTNFPLEVELKNRVTVENRNDQVLVISRDHPQKNLDFLMASWAFVEKANPNAYLDIVGPEFSTRIEGVARGLGLKNFSVQLRTEQLSNYFNNAKLFVSSSRFEGFPNVVLEAISYGIPVISTPSCDLIEDFAQTGAVMVQYSNDPQDFAESIVKLLKDKDQLMKMSQEALSLSMKYSWEQVGESWYRAIAAARDNR